ncbi:hypothetical protein [Clostridium luticellarii]|jgi:hypothetical protein|uniref:hypothetical protein n=1 Tax=Clostridium luticellarii TaxID=1691940 RepID=UPI002354FC01|nr:hypothetical protein [Clostridium luticellarii]MCI1944221.1 hypothetical protein [Clostridium luticellarii]MCI1967723.1 hypothetical protein [Clostridium luticellarii]MCI1994828.1 hypothetical protein [Clostridium luticellarii]MCI2039687.1 hypothetical protein [Clostridium luticellarii]
MGRNEETKYSLSEMIQKLESDTDLLFVDKNGNAFGVGEYGYLEVSDIQKINIKDKSWKVIEKVSNFNDALTEFNDFQKDIYCKYGDSLTHYHPNDIDELHYLIDDKNNPISSDEILNGTWYVDYSDRN